LMNAPRRCRGLGGMKPVLSNASSTLKAGGDGWAGIGRWVWPVERNVLRRGVA
jgi:hypothetical protein